MCTSQCRFSIPKIPIEFLVCFAPHPVCAWLPQVKSCISVLERSNKEGNILSLNFLTEVMSFFSPAGVSLLSYIVDEVKRDYLLEYNEKKLRERRKRVYTFMKTPRELEKVLQMF